MSKYAMSVEMVVRAKKRSSRPAVAIRDLWWRKCNDPLEQKKVNWDAISPFIPQGIIARASELPFFNSDNLVFFVGSFGVFCKKALDLSRSVETAQLLYRVAFLKTMIEMAYCLPGTSEPFKFITKNDVARLRVSYPSHGFDDMQSVDADMRSLFIEILGAPEKHGSMLAILEPLLVSAYERLPNPATKPTLQAVAGISVTASSENPQAPTSPVVGGSDRVDEANAPAAEAVVGPRVQNDMAQEVIVAKAISEEVTSGIVSPAAGPVVVDEGAASEIESSEPPDKNHMAAVRDSAPIGSIASEQSHSIGETPWDQAIRDALRSSFIVASRVPGVESGQHAAVVFDVDGAVLHQGLVEDAQELAQLCQSIGVGDDRASRIVFFVDEIDLGFAGPYCEGVNTRVAFEMAWPELRSHDLNFMAGYLELKTGVETPYANCVLAARAMIVGRSRIGLKRVSFCGGSAR